MNSATMRAHVHPKMMANLTAAGFFNITCTIEVRDPEASRTAMGGVGKVSVWTPVSDELTNCPARMTRLDSVTPKLLWGEIEKDLYEIDLNGLFSLDIEQGNMRANMSTGEILDITSVMGDSDLRYTQMLARAVRPTSETGL